jgi:hypothetical protein
MGSGDISMNLAVLGLTFHTMIGKDLAIVHSSPVMLVYRNNVEVQLTALHPKREGRFMRWATLLEQYCLQFYVMISTQELLTVVKLTGDLHI